MARWVRNVSFLLVVGASFGNIGLLPSALYRVASFLCFAVFLSTFLPWPLRRPTRVATTLAAVLIALAGIVMGGVAELGRFYLYLFLAVALGIGWGDPRTRTGREFWSYVLAFAGVGVLAELVRLFPLLWHLKIRMAAFLSFVGGNIAREDRNLGPTAMGLPLLAALIVLGLVREAISEQRRRYRWLVTVGVLIGAHVFYLVVLTYYARWIARHPAREWFLLNSQYLFLVIGATVYTLLDRTRFPELERVSLGRRVLVGSAATFAVGILVVLAFGWARTPAHTSARVMIYDAGYVNWKVPVHGVYGERSAGMFGMLPSALAAVGFRPVVSKDLSVLDRPDAPECLVMINIQKFFQDEEKERIWRYVARGGGLLCLGDHTGVAGIRGPFNDLLEPVGIRFEFDSSTFFGEGWNEALELRCHPMNRGVKNAEDYEMWVGATLGLDIAARPVVVGRYGYSDVGDAANIERSYLGDRSYNPNELLGDVVLVADARLGEGKILVFGDTSGYQNLSLSRSLDTVAWSVDYLASTGGAGTGLGSQAVALGLIVLTLAAVTWLTRSPLPIVAAALGLGLGSALVQGLTPVPPRFSPDFARVRYDPTLSADLTQERDVAVIDVSHGGGFTLRAWNDNSIGGLQLNLARNGYFPLLREEFPYGDLEKGARLLVLVAPTRRYTPKEVAAIEKFVREGGKMIATVGFEELEGSRSLLGHFGIDVANVPLGRFEVEASPDTLPVLFHEGWPVRFDDRVSGGTEVLLSKWGLPLAVTRKVGEGEIVVIGDSSIFHDLNLETLDRYFAGNIAFLSRITERSNAQ